MAGGGSSGLFAPRVVVAGPFCLEEDSVCSASFFPLAVTSCRNEGEAAKVRDQTSDAKNNKSQ